MSLPASTPLPDALRVWVERETGGVVTRSASHHAGASRAAWNVEVEANGSQRPLFLLKDKRSGGGSARDAAVLRALAGTEVPVPQVVAADEDRGAVLLSRLSGRSDFPAADVSPEHQEAVAAHLMALTARLHALEPRQLSIPHLVLPAKPEDCALGTLAQARGAARALGQTTDPFYSFALDWLETNVPDSVERYSLVHSDMGPGNFLYDDGRITGIVDWEVAHYGDPMEDLAAIAIRDMATPVGSLARRFDEYAACTGSPVDLKRIHYYRALVLVRNSLMIGLGLAHPTRETNVDEMTMYQTLLARAAALVLCDNLGIERPSAEAAIDDAFPQAVTEQGELTADRRAELARIFAIRMHRLAQSREALLGPLFERLPQPLEAP